jgi:hypothetical protein
MATISRSEYKQLTGGLTTEMLLVNPTQLQEGCILRFHDGEFRVYYANGFAFRVRLDCLPEERLADIGQPGTVRLATVEEIEQLILHLGFPYQIVAHLVQPIPERFRTVCFEKIIGA